MRLPILLFILGAELALAQVPTVPNELFPAFRADLNTSLGLAVSTGGSYSNPSWITALAFGKLTGVPSFYATVKANGTSQTQRGTINLLNGTNATWSCADNSGLSSTDCTLNATAGAGGYATVQALGSSLTVRTTLNFGAGLTAVDNSGATRTDVTPNFGASSGTVTQGNDARLSDARTPTAHAASHATGGSDPLAGVLPTGLKIPTPSLGAGSSPVTETWTVGASGVTANSLVQTDASAPLKIVPATTGAYGVALTTVAPAGTVEIARYGTVSCVTDTGGATAGDLVILGTGTVIDCKDSGQTASSAIAITTRIIGVFRSTAIAGATALVELTPAHFGTLIAGGSGSLVVTSGSGVPSAACAAPAPGNLAVYFDTTGKNLYYCNAVTPTWRQFFDDGTGDAHTAFMSLTGLTSGASGFTVNDIAGTSILYILPAVAGTAGQGLTDTGSATCPTLRSGAPALCHQLAWTSSAYAVQTDAATVTWAIGGALNANAVLTFTVHSGSRTLNLTGLVAGGNYQLELFQDGTGGEGLILGTGCTWKMANGGAGGVTLTNAVNALDLLTFTYDGSRCIGTLLANAN